MSTGLLIPQFIECNKVRDVKGRGQGWLVETRVIYCFFNTKLNRLRTLRLVCSSTLTVVSDFTLCVRSGYPLSPVHAPESPLRISLTSPHSPVVFIRSLHANYCNQTQVFLILHLTHLFTPGGIHTQNSQYNFKRWSIGPQN